MSETDLAIIERATANAVASSGVVRALREAGYTVADGATDVLHLIHAVSDDDEHPLCSGYRVFPDGKRCDGCADCSPNDMDEGRRTLDSANTTDRL